VQSDVPASFIPDANVQNLIGGAVPFDKELKNNYITFIPDMVFQFPLFNSSGTISVSGSPIQHGVIQPPVQNQTKCKFLPDPLGTISGT
jgi:hypothetical protein